MNVKAGDKVIVHSLDFGDSFKSVAIVEKVTPSGMVVLKNGSRFNSNGSARGSATSRYSMPFITEYDEETAKKIAKESLERYARHILKSLQGNPDEDVVIKATLKVIDMFSEEVSKKFMGLYKEAGL